jgi:rhodanese-related sulfurtransferase
MQDRIFLLAAAAFLIFLVYRQFAGKVDPARARALVEQGARLVDVRSPGEFAGGHLPGALNIPVGEVGARHGELGDRTRPVVVYCASGMRSASAASALKGLGFSQVYDLGAMARWKG